MNADARSAEKGHARKAFKIILVLGHPDIDSGLITEALGLKPHGQQQAGMPRKTPRGNPLPGSYRETWWNHVFRFVDRTDFLVQLERIVDRLASKKQFLNEFSEQ
jgi:hypothetical protein